MLQAQRAALVGEVLGRYHYPLAGDLALADVHAVPVLGRGQLGILVVVEEQLQALLYEQLAFFMLFFNEVFVHFGVILRSVVCHMAHGGVTAATGNPMKRRQSSATIFS